MPRRPVVKVMDDGKNAVIVIEGLAEDPKMLKRFYEASGKIIDAVMIGTIDIEPAKGENEGYDTSDVVINVEPFKGKTPADVLSETGDKGYFDLSTLMKADKLDGIAKIAANKAMHEYMCNRFASVEDANAYAEKLKEGQCIKFLQYFDYAVTPSLKQDIPEATGFVSYEDVVEYAPIEMKRMAIKMLIDYYKAARK